LRRKSNFEKNHVESYQSEVSKKGKKGKKYEEFGKLHRKRKVDNSFRQKGKCGKGK
jgi:hypothetical protein